MNGLILYGDSIFFGYGASDKGYGCGRQLRKILSAPILIKARNNVTTRDALIGLESSVLSHDKQIYSDVIVLFGNNDSRLVGQDTPAVNIEEYKNNLAAIVKKIISDGRGCYIANLQPIDDGRFLQTAYDIKKNMIQIKSPYLWHKKYSDVCGEVASLCGISLVDIRSPLEKAKVDVFFKDGMHPNDLGHSIICRTIFEALKNKTITVS